VKKQLLLGCGRSRAKRMHVDHELEWGELVTLDHNPEVLPDVVHDLEKMPLPFNDNEFDELHAYGVLEHLGDQGDYKLFFAQFSDFHRILKPGGLLLAIVPSFNAVHQWGDPSHRRVINDVTLSFLSQAVYSQCGTTMMTDFRDIYKADFKPVWMQDQDGLLSFVLKANKAAEA
jgi:predicted SAM-dependent methyltransferase